MIRQCFECDECGQRAFRAEDIIHGKHFQNNNRRFVANHYGLMADDTDKYFERCGHLHVPEFLFDDSYEQAIDELKNTPTRLMTLSSNGSLRAINGPCFSRWYDWVEY